MSVPGPPGMPPGSVGALREVDRWEWRSGDPGDPVSSLSDFLMAAGLPVHDLHSTQTRSAVHGAAVLVSSAAAAQSIGAPVGRASPCPSVPDVVAVVYAEGAPPRDRNSGEWTCGPWTESWTAADHGNAVLAVREAIARGEVYQANVVGHRQASFTGDPGAAATAIAGLPGAIHGGAMTGAGWVVATASPESLVSVRSGRVSTRPIKGTAPRTPAGRAMLLSSAKERAEHIMIVDLERNDLSRLAEVGSVEVEELFAVREWCDLWQAESVVSARLRPGTGLTELLRAIAPGGSVTGTPKRAALDLLNALEPVGRGPSMGAMGYVMPGNVALALTIRTVAFGADRAHVWTGGGITWSSDVAAEVAEARAKSRPIERALDRARASDRR